MAKIYEMVNLISKFELTHKEDKYVLAESLRILVRILEPMMPHLAEECWSILGNSKTLTHVGWPEVNGDFLVREKLTLIIQINGKKRGELEISVNTNEEDIIKKALSLKNISDFTQGKEIKRKIYVPGKILNLVI